MSSRPSSPPCGDERQRALRAMKSALRRSYLRGAAVLALCDAIAALEPPKSRTDR